MAVTFTLLIDLMEKKVLYKCVTLFFLFSMFMFSSLVNSEQLYFNKTQIGDKTKFEYKWKNSTSRQYSMDFELATKNINSDFRHFKALTPSRLQMYSIKKLKQAVAQLDPRKGSVRIKPSYQGVEFDLRSTSREWMEEQSVTLKNIYDSSLKDYLHQEYYIEFQPIGYRGNSSVLTYKPDHVRFAAESADSLKPIIKRLKKILPRANARRTAIFILSWLQSIPYSTLESRTQSNGSGFSPPIKLVANNKGDCDSKVTLMASILKAIFPRLRVAIIYVPEHALIGLNVSHLSSDYKLQINGLDYTLAEPTGPRLIKFSDISDRSKKYIESGMYQTEIF